MQVKETPKPQGPAPKFEGGSRRPRSLMDPNINLKEGQETPKPDGTAHKFEGGSKRPGNLMDPYIHEKEGQKDPETSWART